MEFLDIEQQLRLREAEKMQRRGAEASQPLSYLHLEYYAAASDAIILFGGICAVTGVFLLVSAFLTKTRMANVVRVSFQSSGVSLIPKWTNPPLFSVCMAIWMWILGMQTVCNVLQEVAQQHHRAVKEANAAALVDLSLLHRIHVGTVNPHSIWGLSKEITMQYPPLLQWIMTPTAILLSTQYAGMLCIWCYMLFSGKPLEAGAAAAALVFFPAFYEALLLNGNEPERLPVWITLSNFILSLISLWSFGAPLVRREYREAVRMLQGQAVEALVKDRPELREIRARCGAPGRGASKMRKRI
ncbi:hypothetical protein JKF63_05985 [Porcisia hertigi]|uniref:Uncharacterized protein n=1 Tax=Porcisia hertigi TaxID=2761500 RepID=A0A836LDJ0_9TRYP|nr:hypothetical protein JKF63_05985 [Porcisia hertigi]